MDEDAEFDAAVGARGARLLRHSYTPPEKGGGVPTPSSLARDTRARESEPRVVREPARRCTS